MQPIGTPSAAQTGTQNPVVSEEPAPILALWPQLWPPRSEPRYVTLINLFSALSRPVPSQAWVMHGLEEDDYLHAFMDPDEALARCLQDEEDRIF